MYKRISDPACAKVLLERTALVAVFQPLVGNAVLYDSKPGICVGVATIVHPAGESPLSILRITAELLRNLETFSNLQKSHLVVQLTREVRDSKGSYTFIFITLPFSRDICKVRNRKLFLPKSVA